MSDTPRTEAFIATCGDYEKWPDYRYRLHNFARSLERENDALQEEVSLCHGTLESRDRNISTLMEGNAALKAEVAHLNGRLADEILLRQEKEAEVERLRRVLFFAEVDQQMEKE